MAAASFEDASNVTHSTAFAVLDTLVDEGQILEERADYLKKHFKDLHGRVLEIYKRDNYLLKRARALRSELDQEHDRMQARGDDAKKDDSEIRRLKQQLIDAEKDLTDAQERESILQVEALEYDRRKQHLILEREDAVAAEEARIRPKMELIQSEMTDMAHQVETMTATYQQMEMQHELLLKEEATCESEIAAFNTTLSQAKQQLINTEREPERVMKQLQLVTVNYHGIQRELGLADDKLAAQSDLLSKLDLERSNRSHDFATAQAKLQKLRADMDVKRKTLVTLNTSLEVEIETKDGYQERLTDLERLIKVARIAKKQESDTVERVQREKEKCIREFAMLERSREDLVHEQKSITDSIRLLEKDMVTLERSRKGMQKQVEEAKRDVEARTERLLKEQSKEQDFTKKAAAVLDDIRQVEDLIIERTKQETAKRQELAALATQRQEMNRDNTREASRVSLVKNELRTKEIGTREVRRRHDELQQRLDSLIEVFQGVRRERTQKASQIQFITQKMTEVAEKTKIVEDELGVLQREFALKEKDLIKKKKHLHEITRTCANLRLEKNTQRRRLEKVNDEEREVKARVRRLNGDIATLEDTMVSLRGTYEGVIESRNQTGIQLIDRNDELSLLHEKVKAQEMALAQGIAVTNARGEEVRALKILLADLLRGVEICQKSMPKVKEMEEELDRLTSAVDDERWRVEVLGNELTDPHNPQRWRRVEKVGGGLASNHGELASILAMESIDPTTDSGNPLPTTMGQQVSAAETEGQQRPTGSTQYSEAYVRLKAHRQALEERVEAVNEKLREKQLILEEVTDLAERVGAQAQQGKAFTHALATHVNEYQGGIRQKTRQMMATISELSLFQASSIQLQQEVQRLEELVAEAQDRLAVGEAPFAEAEREYEQAQDSNRRYAEMLQRQREEKHAAVVGPQTVVTTAAPRPNAYVPDDDLGLPKPYGPYQPFFPTRAPVAVGGVKGSVSAGQANAGSVDVRVGRRLASGDTGGATAAPPTGEASSRPLNSASRTPRDSQAATEQQRLSQRSGARKTGFTLGV